MQVKCLHVSVLVKLRSNFLLSGSAAAYWFYNLLQGKVVKQEHLKNCCFLKKKKFKCDKFL